MGTSVAALIVLAVLITAVVLMARSTIVSNTVVGLATKSAVDRSGERARTMFITEAVTGSGSNLTLQVKNTGITSIWDFPHMDFIVTYTEPAGGGTTVVSWLPFTEGGLGDNQWTMTIITPDDIEPGIWNPGERMTLDAVLAPPRKVGTIGTVAVGTPNGISVAASLPPG